MRPAALLKTFPARWAFIPFKLRLKDQCSQLRRERKQLLRATPVANGSARELESRRRLTHRRTGPGWTWSGEKSLFQRFIPVWPATFGSPAGRTREHAVALSRRKGITSPLLPFMGQQVGSSALARRGISLRGTQSSPERAVRTPAITLRTSQSLSAPPQSLTPRRGITHCATQSPRAARDHSPDRGIQLHRQSVTSAWKPRLGRGTEHSPAASPSLVPAAKKFVPPGPSTPTTRILGRTPLGAGRRSIKADAERSKDAPANPACGLAPHRPCGRSPCGRSRSA